MLCPPAELSAAGVCVPVRSRSQTVPYRDPEQRRTYDREYKRTARTGGGPTPSQTVVPIPFRLKKAADVLALIEEQVGAIRGDDVGLSGRGGRDVPD